MKADKSDYRYSYGYRWWVNGVPSTRKYFADTMEQFYKRMEEERKDERDARFIQSQITEQR